MTPKITLHTGNALDILKTLPDNSCDSLVTDPPAGIAFMGREWDTDKGGRKQWIAWLTEILVEAYRVLKPGAHGLIWALPRTAHWTGWALEDAGFEIRDNIVNHINGQGFPKNMDVSKAIDKAAGAEREVVGHRTIAYVDSSCWETPNKGGKKNDPDSLYQPGSIQDVEEGGIRPITAPATPEAEQWEGWGTALKPSQEWWLKARKPLTPNPELDKLLQELSELLGRLLWFSLPVKFAELVSRSKIPEPNVVMSAFALWPVVAARMPQLDESERMGTFSSLEAASTYWNIVSSWNSILGVLFSLLSTSITEMAIALITALRTCKSFLLQTIPESTLRDVMTPVGPRSLAELAGVYSSEKSQRFNRTLAVGIVPESVLPLVRSIVAVTAESLSKIFVAEGASSALDSVTPFTASPSQEIWWLVRKPLSEKTVAANVLKWGTGALNIDATRVGASKRVPGGLSRTSGSVLSGSVDGSLRRETGQETGHNPNVGRWPSNVVFSHIEGESCPDCEGNNSSCSTCQGTGEVGGCRKIGTKKVNSGTAHEPAPSERGMLRSIYSGTNNLGRTVGYADPDGKETVEAWECVPGCPVRQLDNQSGILQSGTVLPHHRRNVDSQLSRGGYSGGFRDTYLNGYGDSGGASRFFYCPKASTKERYFYCRTCDTVYPRSALRVHLKHDLFQHPTQKPLALMEYLVRMVTPPGGTVLDPFCGTGTTGVAARTQGFGFVGIDLDAEAIRVASFRVNDPEIVAEPTLVPVKSYPSPKQSKKILTLFSLGKRK